MVIYHLLYAQIFLYLNGMMMELDITFFNYKDENIKLKDNDKFKIFDNLTNKWCYFQYHISKFDDNKLIYPEYIEPIEYWFTKKDIITYISIFITLILGIINFVINLNNI